MFGIGFPGRLDSLGNVLAVVIDIVVGLRLVAGKRSA
jgi:hypothetical protein